VPAKHPLRTLGADKGFDTAAFVTRLRAMNQTPHVATLKIYQNQEASAENRHRLVAVQHRPLATAARSGCRKHHPRVAQMTVWPRPRLISVPTLDAENKIKT